eukprot:1141307-Pelagomonas_calceolata.AAC.7
MEQGRSGKESKGKECHDESLLQRECAANTVMAASLSQPDRKGKERKSRIHQGRQVTGAGVYHPDNDRPNYVQPNGAGITNTKG